jgi:hypothetical protein
MICEYLTGANRNHLALNLENSGGLSRREEKPQPEINADKKRFAAERLISCSLNF